MAGWVFGQVKRRQAFLENTNNRELSRSNPSKLIQDKCFNMSKKYQQVGTKCGSTVKQLLLNNYFSSNAGSQQNPSLTETFLLSYNVFLRSMVPFPLLARRVKQRQNKHTNREDQTENPSDQVVPIGRVLCFK